MLLLVIPFDGEAAIEGASPIGCNSVHGVEDRK